MFYNFLRPLIFNFNRPEGVRKEAHILIILYHLMLNRGRVQGVRGLIAIILTGDRLDLSKKKGYTALVLHLNIF